MKSTPAAVKQHFADHGLSIREWALARGFSESLVYAVLSEKNKATRGESFRIAVALGLKDEPPLKDAPSFVRDTIRQRSRLDGVHTKERVMT